MFRATPAENLLQAQERAKIFLVIGIPIMAAYGISALRSGSWFLLALIVVYIVVIGASYVALLRGHHRTWMVRPGMATYAALVLYLVAHSGEEHSHALWFFAFPVVSVMLLPPREGIVWSGLSIAIATAIMLLGGPATGTSAYSAAFAACFAITAILITGGMFWSELALQRYQEETSAQRSAIEADSTRLKAEIARRASLEVDLRVLASTDALTGLINRRAFMDRFAQELLRSQRHGPAPTLLILDIDHFKKINDRHGHPAGDAVLAHLARLLRSSLRNVDLVGRIGGEEFAVVLVETNAETGQPVIDRLLDRIRETTVILADATPLNFTVSIGSTEILWGDTIDTAIQRADEALYTAKNSGRDRHCQR
ncbi:MAG: diguanylate cyclase [Dechloromonas sp.]|nr:MAG: diguanylate cyclase [Dechloromonas sp.]